MAYKFTGKERDSTTGLYFYEARYYDPDLGRFISPDTIVQDPLDPQSMNRYAYARNNPILYTDPSGNIFGIDDLIRIVVSTVVHVVIAAINGDDLGNAAITGAIRGAFGGTGIIGQSIGEAAAAAATRRDPLKGAVNGAIDGFLGVGSFGSGSSNSLLPTQAFDLSKAFQQIATASALKAAGNAFVAAVRGEDIGQAALDGALQGASSGLGRVGKGLLPKSPLQTSVVVQGVDPEDSKFFLPGFGTVAGGGRGVIELLKTLVGPKIGAVNIEKLLAGALFIEEGKKFNFSFSGRNIRVEKLFRAMSV